MTILRLQKDIRSYVNISTKGQEKVQRVFRKNPKRTISLKQVQHGHTNLSKITRVKAQTAE